MGSLNEFIEKEGKWFNYIKGVDSDITSETDFGAFDIQGIGSTNNTGLLADPIANTYGVWAFSTSPNTSLQVGDIVYRDNVYTASGGFQTINPANFDNLGTVLYVGAWEDYPVPIFWDLDAGGVWMGYSDSNLSILLIVLNFSPYLYKYGVITTVGATFATDNNYYFFAKNHTINTSSLVGYYADVKFENNSTEKAELFAVSSEVTESSK